MPTKIKVINRVNEDIAKVKVVNTEEEANDLLEKGWTLLHAGAMHMDSHGFNAKPLFVLSKEK